MTQKKSKKTLIIRIIAILLILVGAGVFVFPQVDTQLYNSNQKKLIDDYEKRIKESKKHKHNKSRNNDGHLNYIDLDGLEKAVKRYNKNLVKNGQDNLNADTCQSQAIDLKKYGIYDNIYGYISVPRLNINMVIYLGASEWNMAQGATHLNLTSMPYGQKDSNSVVAGHCGYGARPMFQYINTLHNGDVVYVKTPFEKLTYKVREQRVVEPTNYEAIHIRQNKDLFTLFTCFPYPTNRYRICIYCERV